MKIILLSGKAESGKDTAAQMILDTINGKRVGIGDYIKTFAREYYGWDGQKDEIGRTLLQSIGDKGREINPYFWIYIMKKNIQLMESLGERNIIVPDLRLESELIWFKADYDFGDVISVRVERPGHINSLTEEQKNHPTEIDLDDAEFDHTIYAKNLVQLSDGVRDMLAKFDLKG